MPSWMSHWEVACWEVASWSAVVWVRFVQFKWMTTWLNSYTQSSASTAGSLILNSSAADALTDQKICFFCHSWNLIFGPSPSPPYLHLTFLDPFLLSSHGEACFGCNRLASPLSLPRLPVSGLLVSVWVSSCRLFVDSAGKRREGEV